MFRRGAVVAAGLAMATSFGLAGAGMASAAAPALKIQNQATWTIEVVGAGCQLDVFASNLSFSSPDPQYNGDAGLWSGGGSTVKMKWTAGSDAGAKFVGTFAITPIKAYIGTYSLDGYKYPGSLLVKGAVPGC